MRTAVFEAPIRITGNDYATCGYNAMKHFRGQSYVTHQGEDEDLVYRYDRQSTVAVCRQLYRDNWLFSGAINRALDYIVGHDGFNLQPKTGDSRLDKRIEKELWPRFAEDPESRGLFDWPELQRIAFSETLVAGDTLCLKLGNPAEDLAGKLQHIESERLTSLHSDSRIEQGIELGPGGRPTRFHVANREDGVVNESSTVSYDARSVIFVSGNRWRSTQARTPPILVQSLPIGDRLEQIVTSEAIAWQIISRLAVAINREKPVKVTASRDQKTATSDEPSSMTEYVKALRDVLLIQGKPGDQITPIQQSRPGGNFTDGVRLMVRLFCVPLGIPPEIVLMDWMGANYSNARAILEQMMVTVRRMQQRFVRQFHARVYRWQVGRWVAQGLLPWRKTILAHEWVPPAVPWLDMQKEAEALATKVKYGFETQTGALAAMGKDPREHMEQVTKEIRDAIKLANEINEEFPNAKVDWRELASREIGKTAQAAQAAQAKQAPPSQGQNDTPGAPPPENAEEEEDDE